eukprot:m.109051 g.109051  ORF g.109051 m.109051 type:complete len:1221 (+) comp10686_c1_seq1:183-3845(+)
MPAPPVKRNRKRKAIAPTQIREDDGATSAAVKGGAAIVDTSQDDLAYDASGANDSNALVLPADGQSKRKKKEEPPEKKRLSAKQVKRLKRVLAVKAKKEQRGALLDKVAKSAMTKEQASLLHKSTLIASKLTAKQQLRQQLKEERAGIAVTSTMQQGKGRATVRLTVPRATANTTTAHGGSGPSATQPPNDTSDSDDDSDSSDDIETEQASDATMDTDNNDTKTTADSTDDATTTASTKPAAAPRPVPMPVPPRRGPTTPSAQDLMRQPRVAPAAPTRFVAVERPVEIQQSRLSLPILQEEHTIMEAIKENPVVIICGETGSGKTTQLPQFLYEAGYTRDASGARSHMVGITEPRRIAAVAMADRVARELNLTKRQVSYQIRYEGTVSPATELKFMTDGVLAREIASDFALRKYSAIIVDEAHERSVHTDVLLGLLSRIVPLRESMSKETPMDGSAPVTPLRLIIMSATLRVDDFIKNKRLFPGMHIPIVSVDARQFPVTVHFAKKTRVDVDNVAVAFRKVCQIHDRLPGGGILVFLSGQTDIMDLVTRLRAQYTGTVRVADSSSARGGGGKRGKNHVDKPGSSDASAQQTWGEEEIDGELSDPEDDEHDASKSSASVAPPRRAETTSSPLHVLPLFSALSSKEQAKVFQAPPPGHRLCIVATNVAETSLTIPGIRYVVDAGQVKNRHFDQTTGVVSYNVEWISQASANQRSGRAGRTGPGHAYRLYSSAVFQHDFPTFADPEIKRMPVDGLMLHMKSMDIAKVVNFPFPTPPNADALREAEKLLVLLGALDPRSKHITRLGKTMAKFAVAPRFAKMLCLSQHYDCHRYVVAVVAALSVPELFAQDAAMVLEQEEAAVDNVEESDGPTPPPKPMQQWKLEGIAKGGDFGMLLAAVGACDYAVSKGTSVDVFCASRCIRSKAMNEVRKLRVQLEKHGQTELSLRDDDDLTASAAATTAPSQSSAATQLQPLAPPSAAQEDAVRQIILSGFGDNVARLSTHVEPELAKHGIFGYACDAVDELVYIHPTSALYRRKPEFVTFRELQRGKTRLYMRGLTIIHSEWLPRLVPARCTFAKPLENPAPRYDEEKDDIRCYMAGEFGNLRWPMPPIELSMPSDNPDRYRYFARFLMDGTLFPVLQPFNKHLKNRPDIFNKHWISKERVVAVLQPLVDRQIDTKAKLVAVWEKQPRFLLQAVALWLDSDHHDTLVNLWPPSKPSSSSAK